MTDEIINQKLDILFDLIFGIYARNSEVTAKAITDYGKIKGS